MSINVLYQFRPVFRQYIWGGRKLETMLGKPIEDDGIYAESWEIVDHHTEQSVIDGGPWDGNTIHELLTKHGVDILGQKVFDQINGIETPDNLRGRFPLLFKFLDCNRDLSVQVHPNDEIGATLETPDLGKTEAWYIIDAEPGSQVYAGVNEGVGKEDFRSAIEAGTTDQCLHRFSAQPGDCIFIPAGTIHALGAGLVVAEIQQASDTTFRLFDWNRVGSDGKARQLHIDQGIAASDFDRGPVNPIRPVDQDEQTHRLVQCEKFTMAKRMLATPTTVDLNSCFRLCVLLSGQATFKTEQSEVTLNPFRLALIPACCDEFLIEPSPQCELLEIWV